MRNQVISTLTVVIALLAAMPSKADVAAQQQRESEQVEPGFEEWVRLHLRKLERWGITQLMRTEQRVDRQQKRRASLSTNPLELDQLADDEDSGVRFFVAANRHTPLGTKVQLAQDEVTTVRCGVSMSLRDDPLAAPATRKLVEQVALQLAGDPNVLVRLALAENPQLPASVFPVLAADSDFMVRLRVVANIDVPRPVLASLSADPFVDVRTAALQHRNLPPSVLRQVAADSNAVVRRAVVRNINAPLDLLDSLATDPDPDVRRLVAAHPNTRVETLRRLTRDVDIPVLVAVANHPHADRELLTALAYDDRDPQVRLAAQGRLQPILRREIRDDVLERWVQ